MTGDDALQPKNHLFATLDTTAHEGMLPCKMKLLYIDTIGFIQDVPETLIEPFKVTLDDALIAVCYHLNLILKSFIRKTFIQLNFFTGSHSTCL